jgi:CheY-like chemotaxis protein
VSESVEGKRALVIEDDENNMVLITALLRKGGYRVTEAWTGDEGVRLCLSDPPDFVILDVQLPDTDGFEVLRSLRSSRANGELPIIAMTSYAMAGDRERLLAAGCTGYIEKPIDPATVVDEIRRIVGDRP